MHDRRISSALSGFEKWMGKWGELTPEFFVVSELLYDLCAADGIWVHAVTSGSFMSISFFKERDMEDDQWLWMLEVVDMEGVSLTIRSAAPRAGSKRFLTNLLSQTYSAHDAIQMMEWWGSDDALIPTTVTTQLPENPEFLLEIFSQLDRVTREGAMA